jgi:hypothetical protein
MPACINTLFGHTQFKKWLFLGTTCALSVPLISAPQSWHMFHIAYGASELHTLPFLTFQSQKFFWYTLLFFFRIHPSVQFSSFLTTGRLLYLAYTQQTACNELRACSTSFSTVLRVLVDLLQFCSCYVMHCPTYSIRNVLIINFELWWRKAFIVDHQTLTSETVQRFAQHYLVRNVDTL